MITKQIVFFENNKTCCSLYMKCADDKEAEIIEKFILKTCRVVSHIGYDLKIEIQPCVL